ncbi:MAG: iron-containing alcohol dehydrogenase [Pirellulales bacterium]|nr:iron-containing alcohol dehydrogenase [Pirellulales bacterium]
MGNSTISYDFLAPRQIVFGWGRRRELGQHARRIGRRAWIVCGSSTLAEHGVLAELRELLHDEMVASAELARLAHEPTVTDVDRAVEQLIDQGVREGDFLLAVGGGAAIDLAKAVAAMATNRQSNTIRDYLEGVGRGLTLDADPLPVVAMPTTAGAGAEATKNAVISSYGLPVNENAVISSYDPPFKKSLRDNRLIPRLALVDPELTVSVPPAITAASGMDAITQLVESYLSRKAQPIPQALAMQGLRLALPSIAEAVREPASRGARERMAHAALLSGMALANSGLGLAHGVAPALGVHCRVPHGVACAVMLPAALRVNRLAREKELAHLARVLLKLDHATSDELAVGRLIERIAALSREIGIPRRLSELGVRAEQIPAIVAGSRGSSMSGNPVQITDEHLTDILEAML